jgi:hypothetical protein
MAFSFITLVLDLNRYFAEWLCQICVRKPSAPKNKKNKRSKRSTLSWECMHCHLRFTTSIDDLISHERHCPNQVKFTLDNLVHKLCVFII